MLRIFHGFSICLKLCCLFMTASLIKCLPDGDLCRWMNGRKYYIEAGESGIISVENATSLTNGNPNAQPQIPQRCSVELITCPSCHLEITVLKLDIPTCSNDKTCRCDFLWIKESAYSKSGREYCGHKENGSQDLIFESKTKLVSLDFLYSGSYREAFSLQFSAKKNVYIYKGGFDYYQSNSSGLIQSPNFPGGYPSDYSAEFILQNIDASGFVQLIFTDFQLSLWSYVEVFDSNGTRIDVYNGNTFRPPAIISSGPTLTVKFQANDEYPSTGFQAKYTFVSYPEKYWINKPSTDCGGFVEDYGGAITMMNMVPSNTLKSFDCIWLIRPRNSHVPDTQVSIRVAQFEEMGPKSTLTIRQGQHSIAPLLESVTTYQHHKLPRGQEFVVPATSGFYIRLIGYFTNKSHLAIIYTTFRYEGCYAISDFECENGRCIKSALRCDGFNHCGDGSDEATCFGTNLGTALPEDANWWRTLTPNYYFPKPESGSGAGTNTLILVTSIAGLGMFVLTTVMILVKLHRQRQDDSISREILHTVSGDLDMENSPSHQGGSDLPLYDPPPSYEDVIKLYLPPPPPYSSVGHGRVRSNRHHSTGVENRGYRNDSPNTIHIHSRRSRGGHPSRIGLPDTLNPVILKVSLPEEIEPPVYSPPRDVSCDTSSSEQTVSSVTQEIQTSSEESQTNFSPESLNIIDVCQNKLISQSNSSLNGEKGDSESVPICECQGACSCKLLNRKKVIRCCSESKVMIASSNSNHLGLGKSGVTKKRSFKDMMQKGISRASPSAIIPHPASMTITVRPARSKKTDRRADSKSAGPSSPTSTNSAEFSSDDSNKDHSSSFGHCRSSSGPSELSASLDCIKDLPKEDSEGLSAHKSMSENQILDASNLSQVKHFASVLFDGLQQSFNFKNAENATLSSQVVPNEDDKTILPVNWTNLLATKKKMPDQGETSTPKAERSWNACDTLPLLSSGSKTPVIVKFEDKGTSVFKSSETIQNFEENSKSTSTD